MKRIPSSQFTYERWRAGSLLELGIRHRYGPIKEQIHILLPKVVGYTEAENLLVRPKIGYYAVMFFHEDRHFWTHLTKQEWLLLQT